MCRFHCCLRLHPAEDQSLKEQGYKPPASLYFMKQTISNACGTIGALHAIGNTLDKASLGEWAPGHIRIVIENSGLGAPQVERLSQSVRPWVSPAGRSWSMSCFD